MIRPGPEDKKVSLLICGEELEELKRMTWLMSDSFGLDRRIENYRGKQPIGLHSWDFECLLAVMEDLVENRNKYPDVSLSGYSTLAQLFCRLRDEYHRAFGI